jgi:hypothetical protein
VADLREERTYGKKRITATERKIVKLTKSLANKQDWNWTRMASRRDAADMVLREMAKLGLIGHKSHPLGGDIGIAGSKKFGRVD